MRVMKKNVWKRNSNLFDGSKLISNGSMDQGMKRDDSLTKKCGIEPFEGKEEFLEQFRKLMKREG